MSCIQVTACHSAINCQNVFHLSSVPSMPCVTPIHTNQLPKTSLKRSARASRYPRYAPVCLFGDKGKSDNTSEVSPWKALEKAMGSLKKEQSLEDVLRQQMASQEYYDDGGSGGGKGPGGSGGGSGGNGFGESDDEGFSGIIDEVLQVTTATIGFVFLYIYIINSEDMTRLALDLFKFVFTGKKSIRLRRIAEEWGAFFQRLRTKEEVDEYWLERAIINTNTWFDGPEKYKRILQSRLRSSSDW